MARQHLYELLREEQEPFSLQGFIDERRCRLQRPSSRAMPSRQPPAPAPSSSPLEPLYHHTKSSPLPQQLPYRKASPPSASRFPVVLLLERALKIRNELQLRQQNQKKRRRSSARRKPPLKGLRSGFLLALMKRLVVGKQHLEFVGEADGLPSFKVSVMGLLKWESSCHGRDSDQRAMERARHERNDTDSAMSKPRYRPRLVGDRRNGLEDKEGTRSCIGCRRDAARCRQDDHGWPSVVISGGLVSVEKATIWGSSSTAPWRRQQRGQTPAASPRRPSTHTQLFGGRNDDGRAETEPSYDDEEKEQFSPVSVLDPPFGGEEEEDQRHDHEYHHEHPQGLEKEREVEFEEVDGELLDSFQRGLAAVQRTKQDLVTRIRRFERLADLDPVELDKRLADVEEEEHDDDEEEDGAPLDGSDKEVERVEEPVEPEEQVDVYRVVGEVLGLADAAAGKNIPGALKKLLLDLADEEKGGGAAELADGSPTTTAERVRRRLEAWKRMEYSNTITIDMMVGIDMGRDGETWRKCPEQVCGVAAELEAAVFTFLVDELITEELHGGMRR